MRESVFVTIFENLSCGSGAIKAGLENGFFDMPGFFGGGMSRLLLTQALVEGLVQLYMVG